MPEDLDDPHELAISVQPQANHGAPTADAPEVFHESGKPTPLGRELRDVLVREAGASARFAAILVADLPLHWLFEFLQAHVFEYTPGAGRILDTVNVAVLVIWGGALLLHNLIALGGALVRDARESFGKEEE